MITVLLFETPIAVVSTTEGARAIAIARWLLKETRSIDCMGEAATLRAANRYSARMSNDEERAVFEQRVQIFNGEAHLAAVLL
jgi:hypothetical protein